MLNLKLKSSIATLATLCLLLGSCRKAEQAKITAPSQYPIPVTVTTGMIADVVRIIGGEQVEVTGLIGEGIDPHLYQPTRSDSVALGQADLVFYNGLKLEGKMEDILEKISQKKHVVPVTREITKDLDYLLADGDHHDPHVWMDVQSWSKAASAISKTLSDFDPKNAESYQANLSSYQASLTELDNYARKSLATIPQAQRVLVTAHDAFGYLGKAYDLEVKGIQGISTESEAGVKDIEELITFLVSRDIPAIFVESSVADDNVKALLEGAKARNHQVKIGGELFSDAMGPAKTYEGTYIGMIDHNVTTITRALGGTAPEKGLRGKLSH